MKHPGCHPPPSPGAEGTPTQVLQPVALCSEAGCQGRGSGCPTAATGEQRTVHGSINPEVRRVKCEHLV